MIRRIEITLATICLVFALCVSFYAAYATPVAFKTAAVVKDCAAHRRSIAWQDNGDIVLVLGVKCLDMRYGEATHTFVFTADKHRVLDGSTRQDIGAAPGEVFTQSAMLAATLDKQVVKVLCAAGKCEP